MKKIVTYGLLTVFLYACGNSKISIENSQNIVFEYDQNQPLNYGDTLSVAFYNVNLGGEKIDISGSHQLTVYGESINYNQREKLLSIDKRPTQRDVDELLFYTVIKEKGDSVVYPQKIKLDFSGELKVNLKGESGDVGRGRLPRLRPVLLSEGKTGKDADDGVDGEDGLKARVHIWKEDEMYYLRAEDTISGEVWYYQTTNKENILIDVSGGDGGNGGNGGSGSRGAKGKVTGDKSFSPGKGGDGSNGGDGGNGGNGGTVEVIVHENAQDVMASLTIINKGGLAGKGGEAGKPGKGGKGAPGQKDGEDGKPGEEGKDGMAGNDGEPPIIYIEDFDFKKW